MRAVCWHVMCAALNRKTTHCSEATSMQSTSGPVRADKGRVRYGQVRSSSFSPVKGVFFYLRMISVYDYRSAAKLHHTQSKQQVKLRASPDISILHVFCFDQSCFFHLHLLRTASPPISNIAHLPSLNLHHFPRSCLLFPVFPAHMLQP